MPEKARKGKKREPNAKDKTVTFRSITIERPKILHACARKAADETKHLKPKNPHNARAWKRYMLAMYRRITQLLEARGVEFSLGDTYEVKHEDYVKDQDIGRNWK